MTIADAIKLGRNRLSNSETADIDVNTMLAKVLQRNSSYLFSHAEIELTSEQQLHYESMLQQRQTGMPVAYITGERGFWSLNLSVTADTLIPRPDTECLVELALSKINDQAIVMDLGTGTGAIALALAKEKPRSTVIATDFSWSALQVAKHNAKLNHINNVQFVQMNWLQACTGQKVDVIVSNPPYIEDNDPHLAQGDVRFEPLTALTSGADGLNDIRQIVQQAANCLSQRGWLLVEHGYHQARDVMAIFAHSGFEQIRSNQDYGGNDRVVSGQRTLSL